MLSPPLAAANWARDQLNKGVQAYKNAKYEEAIDHFQQAVNSIPRSSMRGSIWRRRTPSNISPARTLRKTTGWPSRRSTSTKKCCKRDPKNINSVKGIAYLYLQMKKFDDAKDYYRKATELDPNDPEPYYSIAVIDWTQTYQPRMEERAKLGLKPEESLAQGQESLRGVCKEKNTPNIQEGIDNLTKAMQLRPDYDDAMAYHEPDVPRAGRRAVRRSGSARGRPEDGRRVGGQDHGRQEGQGRKAARRRGITMDQNK